ncbi:hypothetical protein CPC08DRAFT_770774 [Agrocybe pediades]|nr:hypothetical protein CPC08DRAFT_770774 [Agrocybe pediades]
MEPTYDFTDPCWYKPDGQIQTVKMRRQHSAPPSLSLSLSPPASAAASSCSTSTSSTSSALSPSTKPHAARRSTAPASLCADFDVDFVGHTKLARSRSKARRREAQIEEGLRVIKQKQLQLQQQYPRSHRRAPPPPPPSRSSWNFTLPLSDPATPFAVSQGNMYGAAASPYALSSSPSSSSSASSSLGSSPTGEEGELKSFFDFDLDMDEVDLLPKPKPVSKSPKSPKSNSPTGRRFLGLTRSKPSAEPSTTPHNPADGIFLGYGLSSSAALPTPQAETLYLDLCAKPKQAAKRESWYHPRPRPRSTQPVLSPFLEVSATDDEKQPWTPATIMESGMKSKSKSKMKMKTTSNQTIIPTAIQPVIQTTNQPARNIHPLYQSLAFTSQIQPPNHIRNDLPSNHDTHTTIRTKLDPAICVTSSKPTTSESVTNTNVHPSTSSNPKSTQPHAVQPQQTPNEQSNKITKINQQETSGY